MPKIRSLFTRSRVIVAAWTAVALAAIGTAIVLGSGTSAPFNGFRVAGHWVYDRTVGAVFHVDGGTKNVDAKVHPVSDNPGAAGTMTLQGPNAGFVVRPDGVVVFDTPTLRVGTTIPMAIGEEPVGLEIAGGPYLVYREAGTAVRLKVPPAVIQLGERLRVRVAESRPDTCRQDHDTHRANRLRR